MDLLPCPFCGEVPELLPGLHRGFSVECENPACVINPETRRACDTAEIAVAEWNTRPTPTPQP
jgi:hypothetical protein